MTALVDREPVAVMFNGMLRNIVEHCSTTEDFFLDSTGTHAKVSAYLRDTPKLPCLSMAHLLRDMISLNKENFLAHVGVAAVSASRSDVGAGETVPNLVDFLDAVLASPGNTWTWLGVCAKSPEHTNHAHQLYNLGVCTEIFARCGVSGDADLCGHYRAFLAKYCVAPVSGVHHTLSARAFRLFSGTVLYRLHQALNNVRFSAH